MPSCFPSIFLIISHIPPNPIIFPFSQNDTRKRRREKAEGSFAHIKGDMSFRRYLCRGQKNVLAESILLAMAHNINKLDSKIQSGSTGTYLFELKKDA